MHPSVHLPPSFAQASRARAVLGSDHPLVRALELEDVVRRDLLVVAAMLAPLALIAWLRVAFAPWLLGAALVSAAALVALVAILRARRREFALALILEGHERLPVQAVAAERARLLAADHRRMLARSLELLRAAASERHDWLRSGTLPYSARTITAAAPAMREVEALLRSERPGTRGVALAQRLLVDGRSPLHGSDAHALREELRRIAVLLQGG
jgi:hypothetical protein